MVRLGYGYRSARSQSQSQITVDGLQYLDVDGDDDVIAGNDFAAV